MRRSYKNLRGARLNRVDKGETDRDYIDGSWRVRNSIPRGISRGERESARRLPPGCPVSGFRSAQGSLPRTPVVLRRGLVVGEGGRQVAVRSGLGKKVFRLLLDELDGVGAGDPPLGRGRLAGDLHEGLGELGGVAGLLAALALPPGLLLLPPLFVVREGQRAEGHRLVRDELRPEKARVYESRVDAERRDFGVQRLHPALDAELRRGVGGNELKPDETRARRDRDDVPRTLLAHYGQDRTRDIHRADEVGGELLLDVVGRQLFEEAGVEVASVVDQDVDVAEPVDGSPHGSLRIGKAGHVQLYHQQVSRLAHRRLHGLGVPAGGDDHVAGGQSRIRDIDAHSTAGASDEPNSLSSHPLVHFPPLDDGTSARMRCIHKKDSLEVAFTGASTGHLFHIRVPHLNSYAFSARNPRERESRRERSVVVNARGYAPGGMRPPGGAAPSRGTHRGRV